MGVKTRLRTRVELNSMKRGRLKNLVLTVVVFRSPVVRRDEQHLLWPYAPVTTRAISPIFLSRHAFAQVNRIDVAA